MTTIKELIEQQQSINKNVDRVFNAGFENGHTTGYDKGNADGQLAEAQMQFSGYYPANYKLPYGVERLKTNCFVYNSYIVYATIPTSVYYMGNGVFMYCGTLREVVFEDGGKLTTWGSGVLSRCTKLVKVYFGCEIAHGAANIIDSSCFTDCAKLEEVIFTQAELNGNVYINQSAVFKKQCAYEIMRKMKDQSGTDKEYAYTVKFHSTVWKNIEDTTAEGYEAPPQYDTWADYINAKCYNT